MRESAPPSRLWIAIGSWWPLFDQVNDVVGPRLPFGPGAINGRVASLAGHPTNRNILYAGAADGGVWRTTDGGVGWRTSRVPQEWPPSIRWSCQP